MCQYTLFVTSCFGFVKPWLRQENNGLEGVVERQTCHVCVFPAESALVHSSPVAARLSSG